MENKISPCAHDWIISITEQDSEEQLDALVIVALQALVRSKKLSVYINKHLESAALPKPVINQNKIAILQPKEIKQFFEKMASDKLTYSTYLEKEVCLIPISHLSGTVGFAILFEPQREDENTYLTVKNVLAIYANQLHLINAAQLDPLTQLLNRQSFDKTLANLVFNVGIHKHRPSAEGEVEAWFIAMLDIDYFKQINDTYGHVIGDEVLILVARLIKNSFRDEDYVFRYGGEEFSVLFRSRVGEPAFNTLERVRKVIEEHEFPQVEHLTISTGYSLACPGTMVPTLVEQADKALYYAKNNGRNLVVDYETISEVGKELLDTEIDHEPELF